MTEYFMEWTGGYITVKGISELEINGDDWSVKISPREIHMDGVIAAIDEAGSYRASKNVYLVFERELKGRKNSVSKKSNTNKYSIGLYEIRYTKLEGVGYYLTIIPELGALFDYIILTPEELYIKTISRRKIYPHIQNDTETIYMV